MSFVPFLQAAGQGASNAQGQLPSLIITVVAMIAIFYFFLIRPQKKKEAEAKNMLANLKKGDKVVTIGGVYGTVFAVKDKTIVLKVDDNAKIEFSKNAISGLASVVDADPKAAKAKEEPKAVKEESKAELSDTQAPAEEKKAPAKKRTTKKEAK